MSETSGNPEQARNPKPEPKEILGDEPKWRGSLWIEDRGAEGRHTLDVYGKSQAEVEQRAREILAARLDKARFGLQANPF